MTIGPLSIPNSYPLVVPWKYAIILFLILILLIPYALIMYYAEGMARREK